MIWKHNLPLQHNVQSLAFSPDIKHLVAGMWRDAVVFDVNTGKTLQVFQDNEVANALAFSPDGTLLATNNKIWNLSTRRPIRMLRQEDASLAFVPDGKTLIVSKPNGLIEWQDTLTGTVKHSVKIGMGTRIKTIAVTPAGVLLVNLYMYIYCYDLQTGALLRRISKPHPYMLGTEPSTLSADGESLVVSNYDNFYIWRLP